jgi:zinc protease
MKKAAMLLIVSLIATPLFGQRKAPAPPPIGSDVASKTLKNGMKVIVWPDHDIPNVAMFIWYRVGSRNEYPGITGLSHFFEHMMFNGAKKYGAGEFDGVMEANGGRNNAYTSQNVTVYQNWFPRTALELIFDLEADRMQHLAFDEKVIESERGVVYSERRSGVDNNNNGLLFEQVQAAAFLAHPYHIPVIGWPSDIESWKHEDLVRYFKTYYAPNNATMIVVGDVTPAEVFKLAETYIEPIPSQPPPDPIRTKEPQQLGERRLVVDKDAQVPLILMAYHSGAATDPDNDALDLLLTILSRGESSRLYRRLVADERVALDVSMFRSPAFDPSLTWLTATVLAGIDPARVEKIIDEELAKVISDGVTEAELQKARNIAAANFWRSMRTISGKAQSIGTYETFYGDYSRLFEQPARYEAVTREELQTVAAKIFRKTNRTVGTLVPRQAAAAQETN